MFCVILKATNNSFQNGMTFCRSIYEKKVMRLLAFIFKKPSYASLQQSPGDGAYSVDLKNHIL